MGNWETEDNQETRNTKLKTKSRQRQDKCWERKRGNKINESAPSLAYNL